MIIYLILYDTSMDNSQTNHLDKFIGYNISADEFVDARRLSPNTER